MVERGIFAILTQDLLWPLGDILQLCTDTASQFVRQVSWPSSQSDQSLSQAGQSARMMETVLVQVLGKEWGWAGIGLPVRITRVDCDKAWMIGTAAEGDFAYLFLEALLEKQGIVRVWGCRGNHTKQSHLAGLNKSTQKTYRRTRTGGRGTVALCSRGQ